MDRRYRQCHLKTVVAQIDPRLCWINATGDGENRAAGARSGVDGDSAGADARSSVSDESADVRCGVEGETGPCQPNKQFPSTDGLRFRSEWFKLYKFLTDDTANDVVRRHTCLRAIREGLRSRSDFRETVSTCLYRSEKQ